MDQTELENNDTDKLFLHTWGIELKNYSGNFTDDFVNAWKEIDNLNYHEGFNIFKELAEKGDKDSQVNLATMYDSNPLLADRNKAIYWYKKAIKNGSIIGEGALGELYRKTEKYDKALSLLTSASAKKDSTACNGLSMMYWIGEGVQEDNNKAIKLMECAAKNSIDYYLYPSNLAGFYLDINDIEKAKENAEKAYAISPFEASAAALRAFEENIIHWIEFSSSNYPAESRIHKNKADFWKEFAKKKFFKEVNDIENQVKDLQNNNHIEESIQNQSDYVYGDDGEITKENYLKLFNSYIYTDTNYNGKHTDDFLQAYSDYKNYDLEKALEKFEILAEKGDLCSQTNAAIIYEGYLPLENLEKAIFWYEKSAQKGCPISQASLAEHYLSQEKFQEAFNYAKLSSQQDFFRGHHALSMIYAQGIEVDQDMKKAIFYMKKAIELTPKTDHEPGIRYFILGEMLQIVEEEEEAKNAFVKGVSLEPKSPNTVNTIIEKYSLHKEAATEIFMATQRMGKRDPSGNPTFDAHEHWAYFWKDLAEKTSVKKLIKKIHEISMEDYSMRMSSEDILDEKRSSSFCFIATAVYQDPDAPQVNILRKFRDKYLLPSKLGNIFVKYYYKYSPYWAKKLSHCSVSRKIVRYIFLNPIVWIISHLGMK